MNFLKHYLTGLLLFASLSAHAEQFQIRFSSLPAPAQAGVLIIELIDGDGMTGSTARITDPAGFAATLDGAASDLGGGQYLIQDDFMISSIAFALPNVFGVLEFSVDAILLDPPAAGFPDSLVFTFLDTSGMPLFQTADPRGTNAAFIFSRTGNETYAPEGFDIVVVQQVPEPGSLLILLTGLALMLAARKYRRAFAAVALGLAAAAPSAHAALEDVSAKVSVTRYPLTYDRAARLYSGVVTVTNRSADVLGSPMHLVIDGLPVTASVNNASGVSPDGKPMVVLPVPAAGLPPGQSIVKFVVRFHNPTNAKLAPTITVLAEGNSSLPPDPGEAGKQTLAGIDSNDNGIRDDVEIYIATHFGQSERLLRALGDFAVAGQRALLATTKQQSFQAVTLQSQSVECLEYVNPDNDAWKSVQSVMVNTPARFQAWLAHQERVSGGVVPGRPIGEWKTSCSFDPSTLRN